MDEVEGNFFCYDCRLETPMSDAFVVPELDSLTGDVAICYFCAVIRGAVD